MDHLGYYPPGLLCGVSPSIAPPLPLIAPPLPLIAPPLPLIASPLIASLRHFPPHAAPSALAGRQAPDPCCPDSRPLNPPKAHLSLRRLLRLLHLSRPRPVHRRPPPARVACYPPHAQPQTTTTTTTPMTTPMTRKRKRKKKRKRKRTGGRTETPSPHLAPPSGECAPYAAARLAASPPPPGPTAAPPPTPGARAVRSPPTRARALGSFPLAAACGTQGTTAAPPRRRLPP